MTLNFEDCLLQILLGPWMSILGHINLANSCNILKYQV